MHLRLRQQMYINRDYSAFGTSIVTIVWRLLRAIGDSETDGPSNPVLNTLYYSLGVLHGSNERQRCNCVH